MSFLCYNLEDINDILLFSTQEFKGFTVEPKWMVPCYRVEF